MKTYLTILILLCFSGCREKSLVEGIVCTQEARVGIKLNVRDLTSGLPAARGAIAILQDQSYRDTLRSLPYADSLSLYGAYERPGVYNVTIKRSGYHDWIRSDVVVNKDECHVITVQLDAYLERSF